MKPPQVAELRRAPLKGARMFGQHSVLIDQQVGVVGDRRYAIKRKPDSTPDEWRPKGQFYVAMNTPQMPAESVVFTEPTTEPGQVQSLNSAYLKGLASRLGIESPLAVLNTKGKFNLTDSKEPYISFLNLESVRRLEAWMGRTVSPERFRMNVWLEGLPAFEELTWVTTYPGTFEFQIGEIRFRVEDVCERCKATEANPATGAYDLPILTALELMMKERNYTGSPKRKKFEVMGVLARPLNSGKISVGDHLIYG